MAISGTAVSIVNDVFGIIFHYLPFHDQARLTKVCKFWKTSLYRLEYEYGRVQALRALNCLSPLNLPVLIGPRIHIHGVKKNYMLCSWRVDHQFMCLFLIDIKTKKENEIHVANLQVARWISSHRFVTISSSDDKPSLDARLWEISKKENLHQIEQIAQEQLAIPEGPTVYSLENRLLVKDSYNQVPGFFSFFSFSKWPRRRTIIIDIQDKEFKTKEIVDRSSVLYTPNATNSKAIFVLNYPGLSTYYLNDTGEPELAWKVENIFFTCIAAVNDRWIVAARPKHYYDIAGAPGIPDEEMFLVFDTRTGQQVYFFKQTYNQWYKFIEMPAWLQEDFLFSLVGNELRIFHIPARSHLTSIDLGERFLVPQLTLSIHCPIQIVQMDEVLRIVYEDIEGIKTKEIKLENQSEKPPLLPVIQIFDPLSVPFLKPTKWNRFCSFLYTVSCLPLRLWSWVCSFF